MKFLIDHQLPPALVRFLQSHGHSAQHVRELGLKEADDSVIWAHAAAHELVVVSKDEDFYYLAVSPGDAGKLLWVRTGNCRKQKLFELFLARLSQIIAAFQAESNIVELR